MTVDQGSAERVHRVDGVTVLGAMSPSRAADFMTCPLLYRYRTVDRIPEPFSVDAVRGTLVHKVLEDLFSLPAEERTPQRARAMLVPTWEWFVEDDPRLADMFADAQADHTSPGFLEWVRSGWEVLDRYFELEDPRRLEPAERELYVETVLDSKLLLRGYVDRLDVAPDGAIRVVDYKGLAIHTPLPTPDGWTTMGAVRVGDELIGSDGRPTVVTVKSDVHHRPCYRVTLHDGSSVVCDNVHQWTVVTSQHQRQTRRTLDTDELHALFQRLADAGGPPPVWIEAAAPLQRPERPDLLLDPWLLGAWLGDGHPGHGSLSVDRRDIGDVLTLVKERWPGDVSVAETPSGVTVTLMSSRSLSTLLREEGLLGHKHIPAGYLRAGIDQRIDLLRGLMDTDGWWSRRRRRARFFTTDDRLAADVVELLRTLGVHPQHGVRPDDDRHIIEFTPRGFNPFSLPRKAIAAERGVTFVQTPPERRVITGVEPVASVPTQCIAVDAPDSLYLAGRGFVPTHNTGSSPGEDFEAKVLFQMKFYALVIWRMRGVVPKMLQLVYLGNGEILRYEPDEADLLATERKVNALWEAISRADELCEWQPNPSRACDWCAHKAICPAWGGTPPPVPPKRGDVRPGDARPRVLRMFDRLRRWWRRST
jgi:RecB family exonuclease